MTNQSESNTVETRCLLSELPFRVFRVFRGCGFFFEAVTKAAQSPKLRLKRSGSLTDGLPPLPPDVLRAPLRCPPLAPFFLSGPRNPQRVARLPSTFSTYSTCFLVSTSASSGPQNRAIDTTPGPVATARQPAA